MRVSKQQSAENRQALVRAAATLFRERGIDGVGVADVCRAAGLTHGALYAHFESKQALAAEAIDSCSAVTDARLADLAARSSDPLGTFLDAYLSPGHRDDPADGCPLSALAADASRQDVPVSAGFAGGFGRSVGTISGLLTAVPTRDRRARATAIVSLLSGAVAASRGVLRSDPELADRILKDARKGARRLADLS
jgi:TetR/AcrR family transcriptional repressor of nem operon